MDTIYRTRFEQFSDGVFAIAITILAVELHVPRLTYADIPRSLTELIPLIPSILTFVLSFMTIAIFWVNHHQLTMHLTRMTRRILWSNIMFLLFLTLIPFATSVVSVNPVHPLAVLTYSLVLFGGSVSFSLLRFFIHRCAGGKWRILGRGIVGPIFYTAAVLGALFSIELAYIFLAIPPLFYFLPKSSA
jgi:uncharacterized membrane protein